MVLYLRYDWLIALCLVHFTCIDLQEECETSLLIEGYISTCKFVQGHSHLIITRHRGKPNKLLTLHQIKKIKKSVSSMTPQAQFFLP